VDIITVLHLEDSEADAELVKRALRLAEITCKITRVQTRETFGAALRDGQVNLILADYQLPQYDGLSALVLAQKLHPEIPFIFVSGTLGEDAAIESMRHGATDYVLKDKLSRLGPAVKRVLRDAENRRERARAEEEQRKLSHVVEQSPVSIVITNRNGEIEYVNPQFCKITGYTADEARGQNPRILKSDYTSQDEYTLLWETILAGKVWRGEFCNRKKNNDLFWESASISPVLNAAGEISHFVAVKEDITERKQAELSIRESESQLRASEVKFRAMIEQATEGYALLDEKGTVIEWNRAKERIWGLKREEVLGLPFYDVQFKVMVAQRRTPERYEQLKAILENALKTGQSPVFSRMIEAELCHPDGRHVFIQQSIFPIKTEEGYRIGSMSLDITERRLAEQKIQALNAELLALYDATIESWANALELRHQEAIGHSQHVVEMTLKLARQLGVPEEELIHIRRGAILHDIGKMGIPDSILLKPGRLTEDEWVVMRLHPLYAYQLLSGIPYLQPALSIPYCHHEAWDGSGYPQGLFGEEIPLAARIFAVVDVWDALGNNRIYRPAWPRSEIIRYLRAQAGKSFDPKIVETFLELVGYYRRAEMSRY
jgi:PAS domain S-box-containing protein